MSTSGCSSLIDQGRILFLILVLALPIGAAVRPQGPARGPISAPRDLELEKQSYRNLDVAKFYYHKRKPEKNDKAGWERINKAVESRLLEIVDTNPGFARMDEVIFMLGEVYHRGGDEEAAREQWSKVVSQYPDSEFKARARKRLDEIKSSRP
jgi:outer membrane protein assembly factor BamD (BamD/ComL family)